jgi:hypothetical protein
VNPGGGPAKFSDLKTQPATSPPNQRLHLARAPFGALVLDCR